MTSRSNDPAAAPAQIEWEFRHLRRATAVLFWFPRETLCPIALYELGGARCVREQPLFVGTHPDYQRQLDVVVQLRLARPEVTVVSDTAALAEQVREWFADRAADWHGACITYYRHGNPDGVSGIPSEAWAERAAGGGLQRLVSFPGDSCAHAPARPRPSSGSHRSSLWSRFGHTGRAAITHLPTQPRLR